MVHAASTASIGLTRTQRLRRLVRGVGRTGTCPPVTAGMGRAVSSVLTRVGILSRVNAASGRVPQGCRTRRNSARLIDR